MNAIGPVLSKQCLCFKQSSNFLLSAKMKNKTKSMQLWSKCVAVWALLQLSYSYSQVWTVHWGTKCIPWLNTWKACIFKKSFKYQLRCAIYPVQYKWINPRCILPIMACLKLECTGKMLLCISSIGPGWWETSWFKSSAGWALFSSWLACSDASADVSGSTQKTKDDIFYQCAWILISYWSDWPNIQTGRRHYVVLTRQDGHPD